jgi:hypothetical protein
VFTQHSETHIHTYRRQKRKRTGKTAMRICLYITRSARNLPVCLFLLFSSVLDVCCCVGVLALSSTRLTGSSGFHSFSYKQALLDGVSSCIHHTCRLFWTECPPALVTHAGSSGRSVLLQAGSSGRSVLLHSSHPQAPLDRVSSCKQALLEGVSSCSIDFACMSSTVGAARCRFGWVNS